MACAGGSELFGAQEHVVIGADHPGDHFHLRAAPIFARDVFIQLGRTNRVPGLTGVEQRLIRRDLRLKVIEEIRPIQRAELEILGPELMLRQQRGEHQYRIVAARSTILSSSPLASYRPAPR